MFRTARHEEVRQLKPSSCLANGASGDMQQAACSHMESDYPHEQCVFCGGIEDISFCIGCTEPVCRECSYSSPIPDACLGYGRECRSCIEMRLQEKGNARGM
jgi:hypothetical protein